MQFVSLTTNTHTHARTHTHTQHLTTTWVDRYQKGKNQSGYYWSKRQWVAVAAAGPYARQITMPAPHHSVFLQDGCPSCRPWGPTNSVKALKAQQNSTTNSINNRTKSPTWHRHCKAQWMRQLNSMKTLTTYHTKDFLVDSKRQIQALWVIFHDPH